MASWSVELKTAFSAIAQQLAFLWPPNSPWGAGVVLLDLISILAVPALGLSFMVVNWRTAPRNEMLRRYPFKVRMQWPLPFCTAWRGLTAADDVEKIERFRHGLFLHFAAIALVGLLEFVYFEFFFVTLHALR